MQLIDYDSSQWAPLASRSRMLMADQTCQETPQRLAAPISFERAHHLALSCHLLRARPRRGEVRLTWHTHASLLHPDAHSM
jgi:hypothetical protein